MPDRLVPSIKDLIPVNIMTFRQTTRDISFDVYLKISGDTVAKVFSSTSGLDYKRLAQYISKGVKELFIDSRDFEAYQKFISTSAKDIFENPKTPQEKKIATLLNMTEQNISEIFSQFTIEEETASTTQKLIRNYVELLTQTPQTLAIILKLVSHGDYLYFHSIAVSVLSMFIGRATGQFNQKTLEIIGLGGFLHDIGCTQLPKETICSPHDLTDEQWQEIHEHPRLGLQMIEGTRTIPDEVRHIVYQHHEQPGGNGYPNGIRMNAIYYPAKVVAIADAFSALISKRPFRPPFTIEQAIRILQQSREKWDQDLVKIAAPLFLTRKSTSSPGSAS